MNSFKKQREEKLSELLDPQLSTSEQVNQLSEFVESEIASAYGRGIRQAQKGKKPSALKTGKIQTKEQFAEEVS